MKTTAKTTISLLCLAAILAAVTTSGCATTKGFGEDLEKVGDKIQDKADR